MLVAFYILFVRLGTQLPSPGLGFLPYGTQLVLLSAGLACLTAIGVSLNANLRLDNLATPFAERAISAVASQERRMDSLAPDERDAVLREITAEFFVQKTSLLKGAPDAGRQKLLNMREHNPDSNGVYIRLVQDREVRSGLDIADPVIVQFDMVSLVATLFVAILGILTTVSYLLAVNVLKAQQADVTQSLLRLQMVGSILTVAIVCFSIYAILVGQATAQLQYVSGAQASMAEPFIASGICIVLLLLLALLGPKDHSPSVLSFFRWLVPLAVPAGAWTIGGSGLPLRQVVGSASNWAVQGIVLTLCLAVTTALVYWYCAILQVDSHQP